MALNKDLVDILACPKCKGSLQQQRAEGDAIAAFVCNTCRLVYPVVDEIPNFIIEEAQPLQG